MQTKRITLWMTILVVFINPIGRLYNTGSNTSTC